MKKRGLLLFAACVLFTASLTAQQPEKGQPKPENQEPPSDWIDPLTGHRVLRLSQEPGTASLYFHQYPYTAKGDKLFVTMKGGLGVVDITTLGTAPAKVVRIAEGTAGTPIVGKNTRTVYYVKGKSIYGTRLDAPYQTREVVKLPPGYSGASGLAINADETLLASTGDDPDGKTLAKKESEEAAKSPFPTPAEFKGGLGSRSMALFTVNIQSGEIKRVHYGTSWLNHTQFSPTDPNMILFCHEGDWWNVNRIWTIRTDGTGLKLMHERTIDKEIAGHEFFSSDGKMVWYDLQTPIAKVFWLAGVNIQTGERIRYPIERVEWSVHFNQSHDGKLFGGDGGGPSSVARGGNGQFIYLFTPKEEKPEILKVGKDNVKVGKLQAEKLVDLSKHDYKLEPNLTFTPDDKWIVFRSNMHGPTHVYAVEVKKAASK